MTPPKVLFFLVRDRPALPPVPCAAPLASLDLLPSSAGPAPTHMGHDTFAAEPSRKHWQRIKWVMDEEQAASQSDANILELISLKCSENSINTAKLLHVAAPSRENKAIREDMFIYLVFLLFQQLIF